jgi:hypothetical protein
MSHHWFGKRSFNLSRSSLKTQRPRSGKKVRWGRKFNANYTMPLKISWKLRVTWKARHQTFDRFVVALYNAKECEKMHENTLRCPNWQCQQFWPKFWQRRNNFCDTIGTVNERTGLGHPNDCPWSYQQLHPVWSTMLVWISCKRQNNLSEQCENAKKTCEMPQSKCQKTERGSFKHDFFLPVEIPVVEHSVWVERSIPILVMSRITRSEISALPNVSVFNCNPPLGTCYIFRISFFGNRSTYPNIFYPLIFSLHKWFRVIGWPEYREPQTIQWPKFCGKTDTVGQELQIKW